MVTAGLKLGLTALMFSLILGLGTLVGTSWVHSSPGQSTLLQRTPASVLFSSPVVQNVSRLPGTDIRLNLSFSDHLDRPVVNGTLSGQAGRNPEGGLNFDLKLNQTMLRLPWVSTTVSGRFAGTLSSSGDDLLLDSWDLKIFNPRGPFMQPGTSLPDLTLTGAATRITGQNSIKAENVQVRFGTQTLAAGQMELSSQEGLQGTWSASVPALFDLLASMLREFPLKLSNPDAWTSTDLDLSFSLPVGQTEGETPARLRIASTTFLGVSFPESGLALNLPPGVLKLVANRESGQPAHEKVHIQTDFKASRPLSFGPVRIASPELSTKLSWDGKRLQAHKARLQASNLSVQTASRTIGTGPFQLTSGSLRLFPGLEAVDALKLDFQNLGALDLWIRADSKQSTFSSTFETGNIELDSLLGIISQAAGLDSDPWSVQGSLTCSGSLTGRKNLPDLKTDCTVKDLALASPDGRILTDRVAVQATAALHSTRQNHGLQAEIGIQAGEALWGTRYANFETTPVALNLEGHSKEGLLPSKIGLQASWSGLGTLIMDSKLEKTPEGLLAHGQSSMNVSHLGKLLELAAPGSSNLTVAGRASFEGRFTAGRSGMAAKGHIQAPDLEIQSADNATRIQDASLDLPLHVVLGSADQGLYQFAPPGWGQLDPGRISFQGQGVKISPIRLSLRPERLLTQGELNLAAPGFKGSLSNIVVHKPTSPDFEVKTRLSIDELDLHTLSPQEFPIQGRITGDLPRIVLNRQALRTTGQLSGTFFGGELGISDLVMLRPFDPSREFGGSCRVTALHMEDLSSSMGGGKVTGRMNLSLQNLRIAYGQPVEFGLKARSVQTQGVKQRISLEAVNSLSIIGTGQGLSGLGIKFYANFFKEFPYQDIGLACALKNDTFTLSGLIHDSGMEYIVKRPILGINVINTTPRNRIAFSDMLKRINRIAKQSDSKKHIADPGAASDID